MPSRKEFVGDPLYDPNRHTFVRKLALDADGR
jgi:GH43 family beta-xylosidase